MHAPRQLWIVFSLLYCILNAPFDLLLKISIGCVLHFDTGMLWNTHIWGLWKKHCKPIFFCTKNWDIYLETHDIPFKKLFKHVYFFVFHCKDRTPAETNTQYPKSIQPLTYVTKNKACPSLIPVCLSLLKISAYDPTVKISHLESLTFYLIWNESFSSSWKPHYNREISYV